MNYKIGDTVKIIHDAYDVMKKLHGNSLSDERVNWSNKIGEITDIDTSHSRHLYCVDDIFVWDRKCLIKIDIPRDIMLEIENEL